MVKLLKYCMVLIFIGVTAANQHLDVGKKPHITIDEVGKPIINLYTTGPGKYNVTVKNTTYGVILYIENTPIKVKSNVIMCGISPLFIDGASDSDSFPWLARIFKPKGGRYGRGVLINNRQVLARLYDRSISSNAQTVEMVAKAKPHYEAEKLDFIKVTEYTYHGETIETGLVLLTIPNDSAHVPICLTSMKTLAPDTPIYFLSDTKNGVKKITPLKLVAFILCAEYYEETYDRVGLDPAVFFCAVSDNNDLGCPYPYRTGAPVMIQENGKWSLIAVNALNIFCGEKYALLMDISGSLEKIKNLSIE